MMQRSGRLHLASARDGPGIFAEQMPVWQHTPWAPMGGSFSHNLGGEFRAAEDQTQINFPLETAARLAKLFSPSIFGAFGFTGTIV